MWTRRAAELNQAYSAHPVWAVGVSGEETARAESEDVRWRNEAWDLMNLNHREAWGRAGSQVARRGRDSTEIGGKRDDCTAREFYDRRL